MDTSTGGEIVSKVSFHESLGEQDGTNIDLSEPPIDLAVFEQMPVLAPLQKGGKGLTTILLLGLLVAITVTAPLKRPAKNLVPHS